MHTITNEAIVDAQKKWANGLVAIGQAFKNGEDYKALASALISELYGYQMDDGIVLFKPTKAAEVPFRASFESALSYFVGGNDDFKEDQGFALTPWKNIDFHNHNTYFHHDMAVVMGYYMFTSAANDLVRVEYTFGYVLDEHGQLKIILHHSSLPFVHNA